MGERLKGKNAIVTGAGRHGIGRGIALYLASEGANVLVNDPGVNLDGAADSKSADEVVSQIKAAGGNAVANLDGIATTEGGEGVIKACLEAFERIDILINAATTQRDRMIFNMSAEEWYSVVNPLLKGKYNTIKPATVLMRQQRYGRIVNLSAVSGLEGAVAQANFGAGMAGTVGLTRVVGRDMGRYGVTCNCIAVGQVADPDFIAPVAAWLCTDEAWNVNAKTFHVSGGEVSGSSVSLALEEIFDRSVVKAGQWTIEELAAIVPGQLLVERANPAPPALDIDVPGRPVPAPAKV